MSVQRQKRNTSKITTYTVEDAGNESESSSSQLKKKKSKKLNNRIVIQETKKKVKLNAPTRFIPNAWNKLIFIVKTISNTDQQNLLSNLEIETQVNDIQIEDEIQPQDKRLKWFYKKKKEDFVSQTQTGLKKPIEFKTQVQTLQDFESRVKDKYYWTSQAIIKDMCKLFASTYMRINSQESYQYLDKIWDEIKPKVQPTIDSFEQSLSNDIKLLLEIDQDFMVKGDNWPIIPDKKDMRSYVEISDYEPNPNLKPYIEQIQEKLSTQKKPTICSKDCSCFKLEEMGSFSYADITWKSTCENRKNRIECIEHLDTDLPCKNMQIQKKEYQRNRRQDQTEFDQDVDVEEAPCWGIDTYTRKIIVTILPNRYNEEQKNEFIRRLLYAINIPVQIQDRPTQHDMVDVLKFIINKSQMLTPIFTKDERKMSKQILKAMKYGATGFRIHTKGFGLVCTNTSGIKNNSLIIPYLGEIYQPWRWYEKQDFIKKQMKEHNQKDILPDFYNIMLDIHNDDKKGIDFLFVDPINKGNYSSRLSHSCNPNCGTVTTVSNGKYVIGMYAMKDIAYGEELTFDYCSFTESKQEQLQAICLCGNEKCKIYYLTLSNSKEYNGILDREHCFLSRNAILLKACSEQNSTKYFDREIFSKYRIGQSVLDKCPEWLQNWVGYIIQFIDAEKELYLEELNKKYQPLPEVLQWNAFTAQQHADDRIQNLVFSLDKIKFFLLNSDTDEPPIQIIKDGELIENMWKDYSSKEKEQSIMNELYNFFYEYKLTKMQEVLHLANKKIQQIKNPRESLIITRYTFLYMSHYILHQQCTFHKDALSLILHMMAFTYTYFRPFEYKGFSSPPMEDLEWRKIGSFKKKTKSEGRQYSSQFVWGQLIGWFKQTVAAPQASLSQDRRGTLSYPAMQSFNTNDIKYPFQETKMVASRSFFIQHLLEKPSYMWPPEIASWSYKNSYKLYGTILFEHFYSTELGNDFLGRVLSKHGCKFEEKLKLFIEFESNKNNLLPDTINQLLKIFDNFNDKENIDLEDNIAVPLPRNKIFGQQINTQREAIMEKARKENRFGDQELLMKFQFISVDVSEITQ